MLSCKILVVLVALPFMVSCLTPVSEDECWKAYKRACMAVRSRHRKHYDSWESDEDSSEEIVAGKKKWRVTTTIATTTEEVEEKTWLIVPMNGLGVPNYGECDLRIAEIGLIFAETSRRILEVLRNNMIAAENILPAIRPPLELQQECPFSAPLDCDETYPYRNADGSCNNLQFPYFGKSSTPFERYLPAAYSDGIDVPRCSVVLGSKLPSARVISTNFHSFSTSNDCQYKLVHLTAFFGIFLGHDLFDYQVFPILEDAPEEETDCCISGLSASCYPIDIPEDDDYFGPYNRTCMAFRRSLPSPHLTCTLGSREQLNRATSFIDASQVYGSDLKVQVELRTMTGGLMRTTPTEYMDLLPQTETYCTSTERNLCFLGACEVVYYEESGNCFAKTFQVGRTYMPALEISIRNPRFYLCSNTDVRYHWEIRDGRVNLHPLIMTQHNLFVREHNRLANLLGATYPDCNDESLFQEARKFVIAEMQHITTNEFLPNILGSALMEVYNLTPLLDCHSRYLPSIHPATRNSFASAAFLFGHSGVKSEFSVNGSRVPFGSLFYNPDIFYNISDAPTIMYEGLTVDLQQKVDRLMTDELTNKLSETEPGNGWDLAALNVQSGRDNGLPTYNIWRRWCGLNMAEDFTSLVDHKDEDKVILQQLYESVDDIDLWTGGISEIHVPGGSVGPTFACITARQFQALKFGDRFWYESAGTHQLPIDALNAIRNISMSRLLCDNTDIEQIQINAFEKASVKNPVVPCTDIPTVDECALVRRYGVWSAWSSCVDSRKSRSRCCTAPTKGSCSCKDIQPDIQIDTCITLGA